MRELLKALDLPASCCDSDKHTLDDEFEKHPQHIWVVADALADARAEQAELKASLGRIEARVRGEQASIESARKRTVKDVDAAVVCDPEVRRAERELQAADLHVERLQGLLSALQAKTSALKHLSELYQAGYYVTTGGKRARARREVD